MTGGRDIAIEEEQRDCRNSRECAACCDLHYSPTSDAQLETIRGVRAVKAHLAYHFPLSANIEQRKTLLTVCVCLLNARTRLVGLSEIRTTYTGQESNTSQWTSRFEEALGEDLF